RGFTASPNLIKIFEVSILAIPSPHNAGLLTTLQMSYIEMEMIMMKMISIPCTAGIIYRIVKEAMVSVNTQQDEIATLSLTCTHYPRLLAQKCIVSHFLSLELQVLTL